jgi:hypothetical protein
MAVDAYVVARELRKTAKQPAHARSEVNRLR